MAKLALEGIRILDNTDIWIGPVIGHLLGDMGAEIIKIEAIQRMSQTRGVMLKPPPGIPSYPNGEAGERPWNRNSGFNAMCRNRYGFTLDITRPKGRELYLELAKKCDVVMENFSVGVAERLGIDYPSLVKVKPDIIMVSLSAYGQTGPFKHHVTYGYLLDAMSGHTAVRGYPGDDITQGWPSYPQDPGGATIGMFLILTALYHRRKTGKGQYIDQSQCEAWMPRIGELYMDYSMNKRVAVPMGDRHTSIAPQGVYHCKADQWWDDRWIAISVASDEEWQTFCQVIGRPELAKDERFADVVSRHKNQDQLDPIITEWSLQHTDYEAMHILQKAGIPSSPAMDAGELCRDEHLAARGYFEVVSHPEAGTHPHPGMTWKMSKTPGSIRMPAPTLGQHNNYVFGNLLGLSKEEMAELEAEKYIGTEYMPGADM